MYRYRCSKEDCQSLWTADKGTLSGFILTCPVCGKGRGIFETQTGETRRNELEGKPEQMIITANKKYVDSIEVLNERIEDFIENMELTVVSKEIETLDNVFEVKIEFIRCIA